MIHPRDDEGVQIHRERRRSVVHQMIDRGVQICKKKTRTNSFVAKKRKRSKTKAPCIADAVPLPAAFKRAGRTSMEPVHAHDDM